MDPFAATGDSRLARLQAIVVMLQQDKVALEAKLAAANDQSNTTKSALTKVSRDSSGHRQTLEQLTAEKNAAEEELNVSAAVRRPGELVGAGQEKR